MPHHKQSWRRVPLVLFLALLTPLYTKIPTYFGFKTEALAQAPAAPSLPPPTLAIPSHEFVIDGAPHRIYFTIDDHPGRQTNQYLDVLKARGLKATFFIVSYVLYAHLRSPHYTPALAMVNALKRALAEGHVIGNHSVSHGLLCSMNKVRVGWEIGNSQTWIKSVLGLTPIYWRPPHGHICPLVQRTATAHGLTTIMWDVDDFRSTPQSMLRIVRLRMKLGKTETTVLFHNNLSKFEGFLKLLYQAGPAAKPIPAQN